MASKSHTSLGAQILTYSGYLFWRRHTLSSMEGISLLILVALMRHWRIFFHFQLRTVSLVLQIRWQMRARYSMLFKCYATIIVQWVALLTMNSYFMMKVRKPGNMLSARMMVLNPSTCTLCLMPEQLKWKITITSHKKLIWSDFRTLGRMQMSG